MFLLKHRPLKNVSWIVAGTSHWEKEHREERKVDAPPVLAGGIWIWWLNTCISMKAAVISLSLSDPQLRAVAGRSGRTTVHPVEIYPHQVNICKNAASLQYNCLSSYHTMHYCPAHFKPLWVPAREKAWVSTLEYQTMPSLLDVAHDGCLCTFTI